MEKTCKHKFIEVHKEIINTNYASRPNYTDKVIIWIFCEKCGKFIKNIDQL